MIDRPAPSPRRQSRRSGWMLRPLIAAVGLSVAFGAGATVQRVAWTDGSDVSASQAFADLEEFETLRETWDVVHNEYVEPDAIDDRELIYGAAEGMVEALGDTGHSRFLDPESARDFEDATRGEFIGVGVELDLRDGRPIVIAPLDGSPADEAGVLPGDTILEVNGQATDDLDFEALRDLIRGDAGTSVTIRLRHAGDETTYEVELIRRKIILDPISWRMLPNGVAHVRIGEFSVGAAKDLAESLDNARNAGAVAILLDLRNNPGGLVAEAIGVASQFMPEGVTIFQQQDRGEEALPVKTVGRHGNGLDLPMVVLANEYSASAAEIVAGALRDNGRARLLGTTTYGTGTVLIPFEQDDGSVVLLGTALWLTADGEQIWKEGVEPDEVVELPLDVVPSRPSDDTDVTNGELKANEDVQLHAAYDALLAQLDEPVATTSLPASLRP